MKYLKLVWDKVNGKKLLGGIALALVAYLLNEFGLINAEQFDMLFQLGLGIAGVGGLHKLYKVVRK